MDILLRISSCDNIRLKNRLCEPKIIDVLICYMKRFEDYKGLVLRIVMIFRFIAKEPTVRNKLEDKGLIPFIIKTLYIYERKDLSNGDDLQLELGTLLLILTKLSPERQNK